MKNNAIVILEANLKEDKVDEFQLLLSKYLPETREYPGFISIKIHKNLEHNTVVFYQEWETIEYYEAYLKWRTDTGVMDILENTFTTAPNIRYWKVLNL